jgi:hypothetical protein
VAGDSPLSERKHFASAKKVAACHDDFSKSVGVSFRSVTSQRDAGHVASSMRSLFLFECIGTQKDPTKEQNATTSAAAIGIHSVSTF